MDAKITKSRLNEMIAYDWIKIIAIFVGAIFLASFVYSVSSARLVNGQMFQIFTLIQTKNSEDLTAELKKEFSFDIYEVSITNVNMPEAGGMQIFTARVSNKEGDLLVLSNEETDRGNNNAYSDMQSFADQEMIVDIDAVIDEAIALKYWDKDKIETQFRSRIKKYKDRKYKTENDILAALKLETERIEKLWKRAESLKQKLDANHDLKAVYERNTAYNMENPDNKKTTVNGCYGIRIDKLYNGNSFAEGEMVISIMRFKAENSDLFYETITALDFLIDKFSA